MGESDGAEGRETGAGAVRKFAASLAMVFLSTAAALACEPIMHRIYTGALVKGETCSAWRQYDAVDAARLSEATDMGEGFVSHYLSDGNACVGEENASVVLDCNTDRAVVFGGDTGVIWELNLDSNGNIIQPDRVRLYGGIEASIKEGRSMTIERILAAAAKLDIPYAIEVPAGGQISINGHKFPIGCGCKLYYPDSAGATQ